jgi:hypothetical protein
MELATLADSHFPELYVVYSDFSLDVHLVSIRAHSVRRYFFDGMISNSIRKFICFDGFSLNYESFI